MQELSCAGSCAGSKIILGVEDDIENGEIRFKLNQIRKKVKKNLWIKNYEKLYSKIKILKKLIVSSKIIYIQYS